MTGEPTGTDEPLKIFEAYETVMSYAAGLEDLPEDERKRRLGMLQDFAILIGRTPDQMVEELFDKVTRKYRKRGFYTDRIREFSAGAGGSPAEQLFRGNVIRSFFIANGLRIPPEKPSWM